MNIDTTRYVEAKSYRGNIQLGQCVYSGLYGGRYGVVYKVHGEQDPGSVEHISIVSMGGSADFDVVFESGNISRRIPECIIRCVQWRISDQIATPDEINELLVHAEQERQRKILEENQQKEAHARAMEKIREENPHLTPLGASKKDPATKNLKKELKLAFPGIKFSVRGDYNSINVNIVEGDVETSAVEEIAKKYQQGHFNGMIDMYESEENPWADVFGGRHYVFVNNHVRHYA